MEFVKPDTSHVAIFLFHEALRRSKATEAAQFKIAERNNKTSEVTKITLVVGRVLIKMLLSSVLRIVPLPFTCPPVSWPLLNLC